MSGKRDKLTGLYRESLHGQGVALSSASDKPGKALIQWA
jgi:hypothetical protein